MTRFLVLGVVVVLGSLSGCASPARYVERTGDSGIVAIPANTDAWPSYNRREAMALIQKHVGGNFEIIEEREVPTGKRTLNDQQVNNGQSHQTVQNTTTTQDVTEWRIAYRRKAAQTGMPMSSMPGASGTNVQQTQYMNGAGAGVRQAGGVIPPVGPIPPAGPAPGSGPGVYGSAGVTYGSMR